MTPLPCKFCGTAVLPENVDAVQLLARCQHCGNVFDLPSASPTRRAPVPLPPNFTVEQDGALLRLTRYWRNYVRALLFGGMSGFVWFNLADLFFNGPPLFSASSSLPFAIQGLVALPFAIFPLAGLGMVYWTVALLINRTVITVDLDRVEVAHGPLWAPGNRRFARADVRQLLVQEQVFRRRGRRKIFYAVRVVTTTDETRALLTKLPEAAQALYIEQEIERFLGLQDVPMQGEISRV